MVDPPCTFPAIGNPGAFAHAHSWRDPDVPSATNRIWLYAEANKPGAYCKIAIERLKRNPQDFHKAFLWKTEEAIIRKAFQKAAADFPFPRAMSLLEA